MWVRLVPGAQAWGLLPEGGGQRWWWPREPESQLAHSRPCNNAPSGEARSAPCLSFVTRVTGRRPFRGSKDDDTEPHPLWMDHALHRRLWLASQGVQERVGPALPEPCSLCVLPSFKGERRLVGVDMRAPGLSWARERAGRGILAGSVRLRAVLPGLRLSGGWKSSINVFSEGKRRCDKCARHWAGAPPRGREPDWATGKGGVPQGDLCHLVTC